MGDFLSLQPFLERIRSPKTAGELFTELGYPVMEPLEEELHNLPSGAREAVAKVWRLVDMQGSLPLRVFHVHLKRSPVRRTPMRRFLEAYYRHYPQGENLFLFTAPGYEELVFVSPRRLPHPREKGKVRLWLRILPVQRERPYRTDLEVLSAIHTHGLRDPAQLWQRHEEAFSVQRVTEQFFRDYAEAFEHIRQRLKKPRGKKGAAWARNYTHQLLNRIMFLYFIARKGWLHGPDGQPDRHFMRHLWQAYRESGEAETFHAKWLGALFFEAFNSRWQNRTEYRCFPSWLRDALAQAPFLNGGLFSRQELDEELQEHLPDEVFQLLFQQWSDGTQPGLFERYNFTVMESGRFDQEVAVDPEMLGMVYERLVNITFEGDEDDLRAAAGVFYTPRTEIDLMCRLALVDWLAGQLGQQHKDLLYQWVFAFTEEEKHEADQALDALDLATLEERLCQVRVCDPACGSGAFLVGMLLVLDDLQARLNKLQRKQETPYQRRKRILQDQLYGVDVMEWAVRVAELRLWLQLVVETDIPPEQRRFRPLLPNLDFKLRPGDSLVQTAGTLDLSHYRRSEMSLPRRLQTRLNQLRKKKQQFFQGRKNGIQESRLKEQLQQEEYRLFCDILATKVKEIDEQLKAKRRQLENLRPQHNLVNTDAPSQDRQYRQIQQRLQQQIQQLAQQRQLHQQALQKLRPGDPPPFVWDLAFVEVFENNRPGFDIIIGNPPYVRQERIRDYLERFQRQEYLERLNQGLRAIYPAFMGSRRRISGRADYYVYFYLHALSLLADGGTFCFITSNSWLDVDFGKDLQEFFLRYGHLKLVLDNRAKRSFAQADINTVIVLAGPPERTVELSPKEMKQRRVHFVAFYKPYEEVLSAVVFSEIEDMSSRRSLYKSLGYFRVLVRPEFRSVRWDQWSLFQEGAQQEKQAQTAETASYQGNKWGGKYLRAPDIFFTILEKGKGKLVRLGDIAEVRRGFTTGANEFFYLEPVGQTVKEVAELARRRPRAPVEVRNGAGWQGRIEAAWLRPVIKSPREIRTLRVRLEDLRYLVFMPPEDVRQAIAKGNRQPWRGYPLAAAYIRWGEREGYQRRRTCASRPRWWDLGTKEAAQVNCNYLVDDRMHFYFADGDVFVSDNFQELHHADEIVTALATVPFIQILCELGGRTPFGGGLLKIQTYEVTDILILSPSALSSSACKRLFSVFKRMVKQEINSIFEELGFSLCRQRRCGHPEHPYEFVEPEALTLEQVQRASPDRFELDAVVFDVLGLNQQERLEVYRAVVQLVKDRLVRARNV